MSTIQWAAQRRTRNRLPPRLSPRPVAVFLGVTADSGHRAAHRPERDKRVTDAARFLRDREAEAVAMMALWSRSRKPHAATERAH